jgi:hypothetical protein
MCAEQNWIREGGSGIWSKLKARAGHILCPIIVTVDRIDVYVKNEASPVPQLTGSLPRYAAAEQQGKQKHEHEAPGDAVAMPWRCRGDSVAIPWRCHAQEGLALPTSYDFPTLESQGM